MTQMDCRAWNGLSPTSSHILMAMTQFAGLLLYSLGTRSESAKTFASSIASCSVRIFASASVMAFSSSCPSESTRPQEQIAYFPRRPLPAGQMGLPRARIPAWRVRRADSDREPSLPHRWNVVDIVAHIADPLPAEAQGGQRDLHGWHLVSSAEQDVLHAEPIRALSNAGVGIGRHEGDLEPLAHQLSDPVAVLAPEEDEALAQVAVAEPTIRERTVHIEDYELDVRSQFHQVLLVNAAWKVSRPLFTHGGQGSRLLSACQEQSPGPYSTRRRRWRTASSAGIGPSSPSPRASSNRRICWTSLAKPWGSNDAAWSVPQAERLSVRCRSMTQAPIATAQSDIQSPVV